MTDPQLTENGVAYYELIEQFELYKYAAGYYFLGRQTFWASGLTGYANTAFVCSFCGKLWGRRHFLGLATWVAYLRPCEAHGDGSLLDQGDFNHIDTMPRGLMEYELAIYGET